MQQNVKLSKRQIKEDKFTAIMLQSKGWLEQNWQYVVIGIAAVIILIVAGSYYSSSQAQAEKEAARELAVAASDYSQGNNQQAMGRLEELASVQSGNDIGKRATFMLAKLHRQGRNYPEAIRWFESYLADYRDEPMVRAGCQAGIAACYEDQGQFAEAAQKFEAAFSEDPDGPLAGNYLHGAMRSYLQLDNEEAARTKLEQIQADFAGSNLVSRSTRLFFEKYPS